MFLEKNDFGNPDGSQIIKFPEFLGKQRFQGKNGTVLLYQKLPKKTFRKAPWSNKIKGVLKENCLIEKIYQKLMAPSNRKVFWKWYFSVQSQTSFTNPQGR